MQKNAYQTLLLWSLFATLLGTAACAGQAEPSARPVEALASDVPPYDFSRPAAVFELGKKLTEISGLTVLDEGHLGAVQDEDGRFYVLNLLTGERERDAKFASDGDFEGLARVGERLYILRSDGELYEIEDWRAEDIDDEKYDLDLPKGCDAEGLAYDEDAARLLIACKEKAGKDRDGHRAIFAFDLVHRALVETPAFLLDLSALGEELSDPKKFKPSGLAVHPVTRQIYVLSSVEKALVVLERNGVVAVVWPLPEDSLEQPEGIAFLPGGDLFIASEGDKRNPVLLRFTFRR